MENRYRKTTSMLYRLTLLLVIWPAKAISVFIRSVLITL